MSHTDEIEELIFRAERLASLCITVCNTTPQISQEVIDSLKDASRTVLLFCKRLERTE